MIVILAHRGDETPQSLAAHWTGHQVSVLTARDLSRPGWSQHHPASSASSEDTAVIDGQLVPNHAISAVLTLATCIQPQELPHIAEHDRSYVAAEMTAFLLSWLARLPCPVLNPPTPSSLAGPDLRREQWVHAALQAGIPTQPIRRSTSPGSQTTEPPPQLATLTVIGDRVLGEAHLTLHRHALKLARHANVQFLTVHFSSARARALFLDADPIPNLSHASAPFAAAILAHLQPASRPS